MRNLKRGLSCFLCLVLSFSTIVTTAGAESTDTKNYSDSNSLEEQIDQAQTEDELNEAMDQYHQSLFNQEILETSNIMTALPPMYGDFITIDRSSIGGTVYLSKKNSGGLSDNVFYSKIIYLSKDEAFSLLKMKVKGTGSLEDFFISYGVDTGTGIITGSIAAALAKELGLKSGALGWIIGLSVSMVLYMLETSDLANLNEALDASTTGKIRIDYAYSVSSFYPFYMYYIYYYPWNHDYIRIPDGYNYSFSEGVYDINK
jgi:hypothetical protein